jgi:hydrogenase expression/formation protein HypC
VCVGLPGRVVEVVDDEHGLVKVDIVGQVTTVATGILRGEGITVEVGDWLEIHMGHALSVISEEDAQQVLGFFHELDAAHHDALSDPNAPPRPIGLLDDATPEDG